MSVLLIESIHKVLNYYWFCSSPLETLRPMELFTQILDRKEAPFSNLLELPSIKSQKLNRRFSTALQTKTLTNTWSLLHAHMPIQTYAASSAKSTAAALFFFYYFCLGSQLFHSFSLPWWLIVVFHGSCCYETEAEIMANSLLMFSHF